MFPTVTDLAPGDAKSADLNPRKYTWARIRSVEDDAFERAYAPLWAEFGEKGEMERRETLAARFGLAPGMAYEMVLVTEGGKLAAVRDHTAIPAEGGEVVVHLSHNLITPEYRRSGLAGWMRAAPVTLAREFRPGAPITLAAEMEYDDGSEAARTVRLRAYEKAGFRKVDPARLSYHQPDFRDPAEIDATGGPQPPRFQLLLRRVGREGEGTITGGEVRRIVKALYAMYGAQFRPQDMAHPALSLEAYPAEDEVLALLPPTA